MRVAVQAVGPAEALLSEPAIPVKTPAPVPGTGASQSSGSPVSASSGAASPASGAERAASWEDTTRPGSTDGSTSAETTEPTKALSPRRTIEITVTFRLWETPLVVIELPAQRSVASTFSVTSTMVSSARPDLAASFKTMLTACCGSIIDHLQYEY